MLIHFRKHTKDDTGDRMKETIKERTILQKEITEGFIDGKNTVAVSDMNEFKRHRGSTFHEYLLPQVGQKRL